MNRENIYSALFSLVSSDASLVTTSRKLRHWSDVPQSQRPALFQAQRKEQALASTGLRTKWVMMVDLYVYVSTKGATSPGTVLNPILDLLTTKLGDQAPGAPQTLGGLVTYARIEGTIETDEGSLGDDAVAIVPVQILVVA